MSRHGFRTSELGYPAFVNFYSLSCGHKLSLDDFYGGHNDTQRYNFFFISPQWPADNDDSRKAIHNSHLSTVKSQKHGWSSLKMHRFIALRCRAFYHFVIGLSGIYELTDILILLFVTQSNKVSGA